MNLKTKAFGLIAALAMCLGIAGSASAANSATTNLTVGTSDTGSFGIAFAATSSDFGSIDTSGAALSTSHDLTTTAGIVITDTVTFRPAFWISIQAGTFYSETSATIPANDLFIDAVYNPEQVRWSSQPGNAPTGDIGLMADDGSCCHYGSQPNGVPFTWDSNNSLESARFIANGYAGSGTIQTQQGMQLRLTVPAAQAPGSYSSTLTATIQFTDPS